MKLKLRRRPVTQKLQRRVIEQITKVDMGTELRRVFCAMLRFVLGPSD